MYLSWYRWGLRVAILLLIFLLFGAFSTATAGPALYYRTLSYPKLPKMSYSECVGKAYRTINLRVKGDTTKAKKNYALGSNSDVTAIVACSKAEKTVVATVMVTSTQKEKASKLLPMLVGDMRTPNF